MSSTVSNDSSPSFLIPSPQELSDMTFDERTLRKIARKFRRHPTDHLLLRYYHFLSVTVEELENSLERAQLERESIHEHLFESQNFTTRIRPLIEDFRQERAVRRWTSHPYDRPRSHNTRPLSTTSPPPLTTEPAGDSSRHPITVDVCGGCERLGHGLCLCTTTTWIDDQRRRDDRQV